LGLLEELLRLFDRPLVVVADLGDDVAVRVVGDADAVDGQLARLHRADSVDEAPALPAGWTAPRRTTWFPSTSRSIRVSRNVRTPPSGVITIGSFSLNDVFRRTGTPVWRSNSAIRR